MAGFALFAYLCIQDLLLSCTKYSVIPANPAFKQNLNLAVASAGCARVGVAIGLTRR
jgi:hypothetical protein